MIREDKARITVTLPKTLIAEIDGIVNAKRRVRFGVYNKSNVVQESLEDYVRKERNYGKG